MVGYLLFQKTYVFSATVLEIYCVFRVAVNNIVH